LARKLKDDFGLLKRELVDIRQTGQTVEHPSR